jgi:uncharacterized membrane protein
MKLFTNFFMQNKKSNTIIFLMGLYCLTLLFLRAKITQNLFLFFLIWNLFLATIPYLSIMYLKANNQLLKNKLKSSILLFIWLLFLPNSFYIITDIVHLSRSHYSTFWYDLILISSFATLGFLLGLISILEFEKISKHICNPKTIDSIILIICFLCGFGIHLGRNLRYNSWDILSNPLLLLIDMCHEIITKEALLFSIHFGLFIYLFYWSKKQLSTSIISKK